MKYVKELLKALLAHYPGQDVEWEEPWCMLFHGHWEDEYINDTCSVNRVYINEKNELSFDLTKESWNNDGDYLDAEELKDVTWDFILDETYEMDWNEYELMEFIQSLCEDLHELVIPSDVTEINEGVFKGCTSLQKIVISDGVKTIGKNAFQGCKSLESVHLSAGVSNIASNSFAEIKEGVFKGCTSLQNIVISDGVKSIGKNAFQGCKSLETVHLPAGVSNIALNSFADCKNLKAIYVPENNVISIRSASLPICIGLL
jgi:hypothetical protein